MRRRYCTDARVSHFAGYPPEYLDYFRIDELTGEVFLLQPVTRADFKEFTLEITVRINVKL